VHQLLLGTGVTQPGAGGLAWRGIR
jgi:hypothetical protein